MEKMLGARKEAILQAVDQEGTVIQEYRALFTIRALADAETRLGKSVGNALQGFVTGRSGVRELAILLMFGMEAERRTRKGGGDPGSFDEACEVIEMVGIEQTATILGPAITDVLQYPKKQETAQEEEQPEEPAEEKN